MDLIREDVTPDGRTSGLKDAASLKCGTDKTACDVPCATSNAECEDKCTADGEGRGELGPIGTSKDQCKADCKAEQEACNKLYDNMHLLLVGTHNVHSCEIMFCVYFCRKMSSIGQIEDPACVCQYFPFIITI